MRMLDKAWGGRTMEEKQISGVEHSKVKDVTASLTQREARLLWDGQETFLREGMVYWE